MCIRIFHTEAYRFPQSSHWNRSHSSISYAGNHLSYLPFKQRNTATHIIRFQSNAYWKVYMNMFIHRHINLKIGRALYNVNLYFQKKASPYLEQSKKRWIPSKHCFHHRIWLAARSMFYISKGLTTWSLIFKWPFSWFLSLYASVKAHLHPGLGHL